MKKKNKGGRPSIISEERVSKLEEAFKTGLNIKDACIYARISRCTYYSYLKKNEEFRYKIYASKRFLFMKAKLLIAKAIIEDHSVKDSWKFLEKFDPRYSNKKIFIKYKTITKYVLVDELPKQRDPVDTLRELMVEYGEKTVPAITA